LVQLVLSVQPVLLARKVCRVFRVKLEQLALLVLLVHKAMLDQLALLVQLALLAQQVLQVHKVFKEFRVKLEQPAP
jgi:hypothetical protein